MNRPRQDGASLAAPDGGVAQLTRAQKRRLRAQARRIRAVSAGSDGAAGARAAPEAGTGQPLFMGIRPASPRRDAQPGRQASAERQRSRSPTPALDRAAPQAQFNDHAEVVQVDEQAAVAEVPWNERRQFNHKGRGKKGKGKGKKR